MLHALNMTVALHTDGRPTKRQAEVICLDQTRHSMCTLPLSSRRLNCERTGIFMTLIFMHHDVGHLEEASVSRPNDGVIHGSLQNGES